MELHRIIEISSVLVFFIGFYGLIASNNIVKSIAAIGLMEIAIVVFLLSFGYSPGIRPPIGPDLESYAAGAYVQIADPLPQALVITAIIIGIAVTAVNLTMLISLVRQFKTADWTVIKKKSME